MALQYAVAVNNAKLDAIETTVGASAKCMLYSGAVPANCAAAATGTLLANLVLPADWLAGAASGSKAKAGAWTGTGAAAGTIGYFRITDTVGTAVGMQGTCGIGTGDMQFDNTNLTVGQAITISTFTINAANT